MTQKIIECLDQLTALLIAAGKCQAGQTPHKVALAREEIAQLTQAGNGDLAVAWLDHCRRLAEDWHNQCRRADGLQRELVAARARYANLCATIKHDIEHNP